MRVQTLQQWAKETGLAVSTMRKAIKRGQLAARQLGNGPTTPFYLTDRDLKDWLDSKLVARSAW